MEQYYAALIALLEKLPHYRSSESITELEKVATDYENILAEVHQTDDDFKNSTNTHLRKVSDIETDLRHAKYGTWEKQREAGFKDAKERLYAAIDALATIVKSRMGSAEKQDLT